MTRFARAKGSKSSNERREEEPTPWHIMRQQLQCQASSHNNESLKEIIKNVNKQEVTDEIWSDFGETKSSNVHVIKNKPSISQNIPSKIKTKLVKKDSTKKIKVEAPLKKQLQINHLTDQTFDKKSFEKYKCSVSKFSNTIQIINTGKTKLKTKEKKEISNGKNSITCKLNNESNLEKGFSKQHNVNSKPVFNEKTNKLNIQKPFMGNNKSNVPYTIIANGREIRISRYDGFLVKKDDAKRLKTLKRQLKGSNVPSDKIKNIMKLERRKAEKALSREKNTVCFQCRQFGHNFSDCPDIKESAISKSGFCFKCGSTEHTHFQCKVTKNQTFRYAICFVCKEQGHIAKQCTLNPQGQYPKGGSCHHCGEVTHLRKDCPKALEEKPSKSFTLNRLNDRQLEDIDGVEVEPKKVNNKKINLVTF